MQSLKGFVRDVHYSPRLSSDIPQPYALTEFNVNTSKHYGLVNIGVSTNNLAYARWISPKRTRSYPFARLYDIFHFSSRKVAIIPIIKDEGADSANNDRINYMTFSWMSLLDIFIVLAWYEDAKPKSGGKNLITKQQLNAEHIRKKLEEISTYHLSALHWNTSHFENEFDSVYRKAVESYQEISIKLGIRLHSSQDHLRVLERFMRNSAFSLEAFKLETLARSLSAAKRETLTSHRLESLLEGEKHLLYVSNYLGGEYHLAPDEIFEENDYIVIQESKNSSKASKLPSKDDIKDGLFKLILYSNLHKLYLEDIEHPFATRLKITGGFSGQLVLPSLDNDVIGEFCVRNRLSPKQTALIYGLQRETQANPPLNISLVGRL